MTLLHRNDRSQSRRCQQLEVLLSAYADGELEGPERIRERCRVEAHLDACAACRSRLETWIRDLALLDLEAVDVPRDPWFVQRLSRRLAAEDRQAARVPGVRHLGWRLLPVAVVVVGLALGTWIRVLLDEPGFDPTLVSRLLEVESSALAPAPRMAEGRAVGTPIEFDELLRPTERESVAIPEFVSGDDPALDSSDSRTMRFDKDR